jgi:hypothetical protein
MTDTLECPSCGGRGTESNETSSGDEMLCAYCGYRFYPPEDRHDYLTRAALRKKPNASSITIDLRRFGDPSGADDGPPAARRRSHPGWRRPGRRPVVGHDGGVEPAAVRIDVTPES